LHTLAELQPLRKVPEAGAVRNGFSTPPLLLLDAAALADAAKRIWIVVASFRTRDAVASVAFARHRTNAEAIGTKRLPQPFCYD